MPEFNTDNNFDIELNGRFGDDNRQDEDVLMERILENMNTTPIGKILRKIASLPEVRRKKILDLRKELTEGRYDINERLDIALDKVLEDLTT